MTTETRPPQAPPTSLARRASRVGTIFRKEFTEIFRDRRTLMSVIIGPLLITPGLMAVIGLVIGGQVEKAKAKAHPISIIGAEQAPTTLRLIEEATQAPGTNFKVGIATRQEAEAQIRDRALNAALVLPPDADARLAKHRTIPITILVDAGSEASQQAAGRLSGLLNEVGKRLVAQRLQANGLSPELATPFKAEEKPIAEGRSMATLILSRMLPYILILGAFGGAIYAAFDQVAGEKERGTLETLLVSPASRRDIVLGKFSAVVCVCMISSILSIVGMLIPFVSGMKAFAWLARGGATFSPVAFGVILLVLLPLAVLFAGALLALSTFARNQKEAQTYLGSLFPIVLLPAMMSMFLDADSGPAIALVPVLGASIIIKQALVGSYDIVFILVAFAASVGWAALALMVATRMFQKESVLIKA